MKLFWVYMVQRDDGSYYTGVTNNVERRVAEHNAGIDERAYTHRRRPVELVYSAEFFDATSAIAWEKQIQKWSRRKKEALIAGDFVELKRLAKRQSGASSSSAVVRRGSP